ncbi:MAG: glycosyltransferase [Candidatus Shapirobacteria bacterium]|nr:glycosyltransferase [Candidatus Shapirobacteria bacterium]
MIQNLKVAIFYDWLNQWGGAEKVLLDILKIFPESPIFTLVYDPKKTNWLPKETQIIPSSINKLPLSKKNSIFYTPFYGLALEQFDFSQYDIVISTTQVSGHYLLTQPKTLFVCYMHNTNRYLYQTPPQFKFLSPLLNHYKKTDFAYGQRPDYLLCNSQTVSQRIKSAYNRSATVIYPGVDTDFFTPGNKNQQESYFLIVSRLVLHKHIDLAIKVCNRLNKKLIIVGEGRDKNKLIKIRNQNPKSNVIFFGHVSDKKLLFLYQNCQALICPQIEDYGLSPLEAQACGKPVIAYNQGGITETVINDKTGIFFKEQSEESLSQAIDSFKAQNFSPQDCIDNAKRFSRQNFMLHFKQTIDKLWQQHQTISL